MAEIILIGANDELTPFEGTNVVLRSGWLLFTPAGGPSVVAVPVWRVDRVHFEDGEEFVTS